MGIRYMVCPKIIGGEKAIQDLSMPRGGMRNPGRPAIEPFLHLPPGVFEGLGTLENAGIGYNTDKAQQTRPGKAEWFESLKFFFFLVARDGVLLDCNNVGVEEVIGIDNAHRKSSPSAIARTSATSSMLPMRQRPRSTARV
jgi:hypothetical protein